MDKYKLTDIQVLKIARQKMDLSKLIDISKKYKKFLKKVKSCKKHLTKKTQIFHYIINNR